MKKAAKIFIFFILSVMTMTALCACAGLSACFANGGTGNNGAGGAVGKWDVYDGVMLAFMDEIAYNDGDIDDSKVLPELNCLLGKKYYMTADFEIEAPYDNDGSETVTANVKIQPAAMVKATIQDTNTASVKEETEDGITSISATYKIPDKADSVRNMRLVIQFEAIKSGLADVELSFESSGEIQGVKTLKIEKSAVMGYTEGLEYALENDFYSVKGLGSSTADEIVIPSLLDGNIVTGIGISAFNGCGKIIKLTIPNSVRVIGANAFKGCIGLTTVITSDSVTSIGNYAFHGCKSLISITLSNRLETIFYEAFRECSSLSSITFKGTKEQWDIIDKAVDWNYKTGEYVVHCTDGDLTKAQS